MKPVWRVTTRLGRRVETTGHHPFLTPLGWQPLHDLKPGDSIAVPRVHPSFGDNSSTPLELARLMAAEITTEFHASVWRFDEIRLREYLRVLFDRNATRASQIIEFNVSGESMARDVQHALVRFGVVSRIHLTGSWRITIEEPEALERFASRVGWLGEKHPAPERRF
ncbi:MAG: hypothetical protein HC933_15755 [Pleurocapsa sp. SU_196_0]|nr:hypothetical protein [Pleurocapsa sp. SU_196_0]